MKYRDFFITESWKDYVVSTNPETLLYDFYVLSYLTTLPLQPGEKGFTGTLIGRDPQEIKLDIKNAENLLLPALQKQLSNALFIAICAEIRHVLDNKQDWSKYVKNKLVKNYIRNYKALKELPSEFKPTRGIVQPRLEPKEAAYTQSYQAAIKAINESGSTKEEFARIASDMFRTMKWSSAYGGEKWAQIADAYNLLNKTPQTNQQLQVAIDHAYDLQHNTGAVLNKVKNYYINNSIGWLSNALDFKANLKSVYDLLPKCSSDMRKLALEAFKTAGVKNNALQKSVDNKTTTFKVGDFIKYKTNPPEPIEINGVITSVDGTNDNTSVVKITKIITLPEKPSSAVAADWKVGDKVVTYKAYMTKMGEKTTNSTSKDKVNKSKQYQVGDVILFSGYVCQIYKIFPEHIHLKVVKTGVSHIKLNSISEYKKRSFEKEIIGNYPMLSIKDFKIGDKFKNIDTGEVGVVQATMYRSIVIYTVSEDGKDPLYKQIYIKELVGNVEFLSKASSDELPKVDFGAGLEPEDDSGGKNVGKFVEFRDSPLLTGQKKLIFTGKIIGYAWASQEYSIKILSVTPANTNNYDYTVGEITRWPDDGSLKIVDAKNLDISTSSSSKELINKLSKIDSIIKFEHVITTLTYTHLNNRDIKRKVKGLTRDEAYAYLGIVRDATTKLIQDDILSLIKLNISEIDPTDIQLPIVREFITKFEKMRVEKLDQSVNSLKSLFAIKPNLETFYRSDDLIPFLKKIYEDFNSLYYESFKALFFAVKEFPISVQPFQPDLKRFDIKGNEI